MSEAIDVLVLRKGVHEISTARYAERLREHLPDGVTVTRPGTPAAEVAAAEEAKVITGHDIDADTIERASNLRLFACASAGYESLPLDALAENDVTVTNASGCTARTSPNTSSGRCRWRFYQSAEAIADP